MSYTFGLDSRNRIASYVSDSPIRSQDVDDNYLKTFGISPTDARLKFRLDPTTGIKFYYSSMGLQLKTVLNAAQPKYIDVPYDPYPVVKWGVENEYVTRWNDFDLKSQIGEDKWNTLWESFKCVPRNKFEEMSCDILSVVTNNKKYRAKKGSEILSLTSFKNFILDELQVFIVASHLIDIFNRANLEAMKLAGVLLASDWESKKYRSYATKDAEKEIQALEASLFTDATSRGWISDSLNQKKFEERIKNLPKAKDPLLNLQRDATLAGMIANKEWNQLNLLCSIYEQMDPNLKDILAQV